jgi:hypothetical protein
MSNTITPQRAADFNVLINEAELAGLTGFAAIEAAVEPLAAAVFDQAAQGRHVDLEHLMEALIERHDLDADPAYYIRTTLDRNIAAGGDRFTIGAHMHNESDRAIAAAAGVLAWEVWRAEHADDMRPDANSMPVRNVAKHLARRCRDVIGESLAPEESAWAAVVGAQRARLPIDRIAWSYALEGAEAGERERLEEIARHIEDLAA